MPRDFSEPWEPEDILDRLAAQEHRERMEAAKASNEQRLEQEARQAAELKVKADDLTRRANASAMIREYRDRGVEPPLTNRRGEPRVSLGLLLQIGWRIESVGGENQLIAPPVIRTRKQIEQDRGPDGGS